MIEICKTFLIFSIYLSLQIIPQSTYSQDSSKKIIYGKTVDKTNSPIENVVVILEEKRGNVIAFGQTDEVGKYLIKYSTLQDSILLKFRRIGLKTLIKVIPVSLEELDVIMELAPENALEEVVVKSRRPIESSGDTISYNPRYFKDGTERTVEDLLSKLPGISVDVSTGTIKYQGQEIKKILLDGDDLAGSNYKVLSKNLSVDWLEGVEVVKKFNDKRLLRGIKQSDDIAINLKLNESAKAPIFGKADIGAGVESKYTLKSELLSYLKKLKLFLITETNNIGIDLEIYDLETYMDNQNGSKGFYTPDKLLDNELKPPNYFKQEDFTFHHGVFVSNAMVLRPSEHLKIRSLTNYYDNHLDFFTSDSLSYNLPNGLELSINEFQSQVQRPQELFQDLKIDYTIKDSQDLSIRLQYKNVQSRTNSLNETAFRKVSQLDALEQNSVLAVANYINKINEKIAMEIEFRLGNENFDEALKVLNDNQSTQNFNQILRQKYFNIGSAMNFYGKLSENTFVNSYSGWNKSTVEFSPLFSSLYTINNFYSEIELRKQLKKITINASARIRNVNLKLDEQRTNKTLFEPLLGISFEDYLFSSLELKVKTLISIENNFLKPSQLFNQSIFIDYRSIISHDADFTLPQKSYLFFNTIKIAENENAFLSANFEVGIERLENGFVPHLSFQEDIVTTQYIQSKNVESVFTNIGIDKYFSKLRTNVGLSYLSQLNKSFLSIEDNLGKSRLLLHQLKVDAGIVLSKKISLSTFVAINNNKNEWSINKNDFNYRNYFFKLVLKANQKFSLIGDTQVLDFGKRLGGVNSLSNFSAVFNPKNENWSFNVNLRNIFDNRNVGISNNSLGLFSKTNYPIQPRFFLVTITHKF